ncbi:DNA replication factor C, large subunit [Macrolepiota fuliginosa MF-IS2]|uniref:Replication factor C subunit 1 n=1 Tax=Macrolepiota fuliginosa MF-IS2 TaxID=1400762 RepID=A0A9P6C2Y1_9AGAR|nr:DNA replication factor C, large subunit [Macrolepiota fuliginosa MF-IS2]
MPPKTDKSAKGGGKDIRMFFGGGTSQKSSGTGSTAGSQSKKPTDIKIEDRTPAEPRTSQSKKKAVIVDSDDEPIVPVKSRARASMVIGDSEDEKPKNSSRKRKSTVHLDDDNESSPPKKKAAVSATKSKPAKATKARRKDEDYEMDESSSGEDDDDDFIVDDEDDVKRKPKRKPVPTKTSKAAPSEAPTKIQATKEVKSAAKPNWAAIKAAKLAGPSAPGSKEVPDGAPNCLLGLSFVFTGELSSLSREEAVDLAKRFGGRVVLQPSSRTNYVILGDNAGPAKIAAIKKHNLTALNEDEFLNLIATRKGADVDDKTKKKLEKEKEDIRKVAKEMEKREKASTQAEVDPSTQLWTTRYTPHSLKEICGNKSQVDRLLQWLKDWPDSLKAGFKRPGKNGMNMFRGVLITGSPGIGKTTSAHLCAKLAGLTPIELNASDTRSKKLVENGMNVNNTSLDGFIQGAGSTNSLGVPITDRTCLIMDEVDGMSAGDRGGVGALNALIRKSKIPIICIANDRGAQKLKPLMSTTYSLPFHKPQAQMIRSRILSIVYKEKLDIPANVIDQLIQGVQSDIRQVLNMLSTWKLSSDKMNFDEGKTLVKMNEKYAIMTPFDITTKIFGPHLFSPTAKETLGEKMELYFQDHSFVPLFIQENYLRSQPARVRNLDGPEKELKHLRLMEQAAASISDADLVDALIHGPEQHWSLMPLHAVCSTVKPASCLYGGGVHWGGPNSMAFPQWLGQNSKQNKLARQLVDVQVRMRLKVSGDKTEIRQSYIPSLFPYIVTPLIDIGVGAVDDVIERMDEYYLSKEDWETIVELGVGDHKDVKIPTAAKSSFTRKYNASEHPIPFHKAQDLGKVPKKLSGGPAPDLEEAFIDDIEEEEEEEVKTKESSDDLVGDKLIKAPRKKKAAASTKAKASKKGT